MLREFHDVRVVFFDAVGTLFRVRGSVGEIYSRIAARYGVACTPELVQKKFARAFQRKTSEGIAPDDAADPTLSEKGWWLDIVREVFDRQMSEPVLLAYFEEVFELFRTAEAWELFSDTPASLSELRLRGFRLGIISNFDSRLFDLLENLGVASSFENVILSWRVGASKPDPRIFQQALRVAGVAPARALHAGDSLDEDAKAAVGAGLHAVLVDRGGVHDPLENIPRVGNLSELCRLL